MNCLCDAESKFVDCALVGEEEIEQAIMHRTFLDLFLEIGSNHDGALVVFLMFFMSIGTGTLGRSPLFELEKVRVDTDE